MNKPEDCQKWPKKKTKQNYVLHNLGKEGKGSSHQGCGSVVKK